VQAVGFGLPSSASMVADRFLVCFKLFAFALFGLGLSFGLLCRLLFLVSFGLSGWFPLLSTARF